MKSASKSPVPGIALMLAGPSGETSSVGSGGVHVRPPSVERKPNCDPWSVRLHEKSDPSAVSTTPGSCKPLPLGFGIAHHEFASVQVTPSSSE